MSTVSVGFLCKGFCGARIATPGYCYRCEDEARALNALWGSQQDAIQSGARAAERPTQASITASQRDALRFGARVAAPTPLTISEVFVCPGCERVLDAAGICEECEAERELLNDKWRFERQLRKRREPLQWTFWLQVAVVFVCGGYVFYKIAEMFADWIAGGMQ